MAVRPVRKANRDRVSILNNSLPADQDKAAKAMCTEATTGSMMRERAGALIWLAIKVIPPQPSTMLLPG